tara:strand:+ start:5512 stop:5736 length:225 start_codon:yes stop_codon:yes gene_type:complete
MPDPKIEIIPSAAHPTDETFPHLSKTLLVKLELIFKDTCPTLVMKDREIWFRCGQVDVVRFLRQEYERQQNPER